MFQVDSYRLNSTAELDEVCLCKDANDTGIFFLDCCLSLLISNLSELINSVLL